MPTQIKHLATLLLHLSATGTLFAAFMLPLARAQDCVPVYGGCTACEYSAIDDDGFPVTGIDTLCTSNSLTPYPTQYIGAIAAWCTAFVPLPSTGQSCGVAQPSDPNLQNVHRFYRDGDHFLTTSYSEGVYAGYRYEGVAFVAHKSPIDSSMQLLYRCYSGGHFVSVNANCEGYRNEGSYGYVSTVPRSGFTALHRFYRRGSRDHLTTTNYDEGVNARFSYEGVLGYVPLLN